MRVARSKATDANVSRMEAAGAVASRLGLFASKTLGLVVTRLASRGRYVAMLVAVAMFITYWGTISPDWKDWTRPATAATSALECGQEFCCGVHRLIIPAKSETQGESPRCRICGVLPFLQKQNGNP